INDRARLFGGSLNDELIDGDAYQRCGFLQLVYDGLRRACRDAGSFFCLGCHVGYLYVFVRVLLEVYVLVGFVSHCGRFSTTRCLSWGRGKYISWCQFVTNGFGLARRKLYFRETRRPESLATLRGTSGGVLCSVNVSRTGTCG